jgi:Short-chain dehydrogenase involved in D-alanine esterification of lipoteichoic acid and wall teichoic acid (D-alanine transfer protein)
MQLSENTVLITGGSNGIGLALAERFLKNGNEVIICSSSDERLDAAKKKHPPLHIIKCDLADEAARIKLFEEVTKDFPNINVLINNAGIQVHTKFTSGQPAWEEMKREIAINLETPVHLSLLFLQHLANTKNAAIINVSSTLAFMIPVWVPTYGATKAAVHSFTFSLRAQAEPLGISVYEIIPPAVNTDLGAPGMHTFGVDVNLFVDEVFEGLAKGNAEIGYNGSMDMTYKPRREIEATALNVWNRRNS